MPSRLSSQKLAAWYARFALIVACVFFARMYVTTAPSYMNLPAYARGVERMPFQGRDLMRWPLLWAERSRAAARLSASHKGFESPDKLVLQGIGVVSLLLAGWASIRLYRLLQPEGRAPLLPWALMIVLCLFNLTQFAPYSFPYDLPAMAFLGWGTYLVFARRFGWLVPLFIAATLNRETTLFLIALLLVTAAVRDGRLHWRHLRPADLGRVALLSLLWIAIWLLQKHRYAANPTEAGPRISLNLHEMTRPDLWPNMLSASAFLLPWIFLLRRRVPDPRLQAALLILPFWVLLLLSVGQILELRIYGDISVFVGVTAAVLLEQAILKPTKETLLAA